MKLVIKLSYLGTRFHGSQIQPNQRTVTGVLKEVLREVYGADCTVCGCSRTDAGVHAKEYYMMADFTASDAVPLPVPLSRAPMVLNNFLPEDVSVLDVFYPAEGFHPRFSAVAKEYRYLIRNSRVKDPFLYRRALLYKRPLDEKLLDAAAADFLGTHDFTAFMAQGSDVSTTQRTVHYARVTREGDGDDVVFTVCADGFLYNMVRIMTGTLLYIAEGKIPADGIPHIIASKDRARAGVNVPPHGLYLSRVDYGTVPIRRDETAQN